MDEEQFKKRISELRIRAEKTYTPQFTDFLTLGECSLATPLLRSFCVFGGAEDTERNMIGIAPDDGTVTREEFPISGISIIPKNVKFSEELTHRDILGSILALSLKRTVIGDIFVGKTEYYLFCASHIADFLVQNLVKIKHTFVSCEFSDFRADLFMREFRLVRETVASLRLDVLVSAAFRVARGVSSKDILAGRVFVNGVLITSASCALKEGDVISYRGHGKFRLKEIGGKTKKERLCVLIEIYQ